MRYEYKIKMEADLYGVPFIEEISPLAKSAADLTAGTIKAELKEVLDHYKMSHKFCNIQINVVPHDNNRIYSEEDAERHLNGEPEKKRKTYAEDFFDKFPKARKLDVLTDGGVKPVPAANFDGVYGEKKAEALRGKMNILFPNSLGDHFALWLAEMDDGE